MDQNANDPSKQAAAAETANDPLLRLAGSGKRLWADEPADEYVNNLRGPWTDESHA